jgi:paraquat-inducible protein B
MSDANSQMPDIGSVPEAEVSTHKRRISIVWLVPLVAVLIGVWLVYKAISETGPTVTIVFKSAEGLEAGKTKIKYKDVELGQVSSIELADDLSHVIVTAEMHKQSEKFISQNTRFWVVRARVAAGNVSGLGTLFSGAYIGMDPGNPGKPKLHFIGLEVPPVVTTDLPGRHFTLRSPTLGSLDIGVPVYYRHIKVGQVVSYQLDEDGQAVTIKVFIHAPHHKLVRKNTRFWNASGFNLVADAAGVRVNTESLVTLMIGGIAFDLPFGSQPEAPAEENRVFKLYPDRESINKKPFARKQFWLLHFDGSVKGLKIGAPVELRGIRIGRVLDINLKFDYQKNIFRVPVLIETEPDRLSTTGDLPKGKKRQKIMDYLVANGLRAQLKSGSLLTGQLLVSIDMHPEAPPAKIKWAGKYPELPTVPASMEQITENITRFMAKLDKLPLEQIGADLQQTAHGARKLVNSPELLEAIANLNASLKEIKLMVADLRTNVTPEMTTTLEQARKSLAAAEQTLATDSALPVKMKSALDEMSAAARSLRLLLDYLERHPEALLRGKGTQ